MSILSKWYEKRRRFNFRRSGRSAYRFTLRNWSSIPDINLVARALEIETLRKIVTASPLPIDRFRKITVIAPHQDDELIGAGGFCVLAQKSGAAISIIYLTDGAVRGMQGKNGELLAPEESAEIRQTEARAVCSELGAEYLCLGISNLTVAPERSHVEALASALREFSADLILLPWLFDSAPKHRMATHMLWLANRLERTTAREIWGYQVNNGLFANGVVDISTVMERKLELIRLYRSQNEFLRRYDHQAMGLGAWNSRYLESKGAALAPSYAELFFALPTREFETVVANSYLADLAATYHGSRKLIASMSALQAEFPSSSRAKAARPRSPSSTDFPNKPVLR